jgi:TusA-related sulfurtransferase
VRWQVKQDSEIKINARGLSNPGPRMMVETALAEGEYEAVRVVVSSVEAMEDLRGYFESLGASIETDHIGDDYHIFVDLRKRT